MPQLSKLALEESSSLAPLPANACPRRATGRASGRSLTSPGRRLGECSAEGIQRLRVAKDEVVVEVVRAMGGDDFARALVDDHPTGIHEQRVSSGTGYANLLP